MKEKKENLRNKDHNSFPPAELPQDGGRQNTSAEQQDVTDINEEKKISRTSATERGAGTSTKRNITGSDYDGQAI